MKRKTTQKKESKTNEKNKKEQIKENNVDFYNSFFTVNRKLRHDMQIDAFNTMYNSSKSGRSISSSDITTYIERPYDNATKLQSAMRYIMNNNGMIKELILYKSNMLTLDHYLLCYDMSKYKNSSKFDKDYAKAVQELRKYNVRFNISWMMENLIRDGELYIYKIEDDTGITFLPIPCDYCKITTAEGTVQHYSFNFNALNEQNVGAFPKDIQKLYNKKSSLQNKEEWKNGYYPLDETKAYAFSLEYLMPKNIPYYTSLLTTLYRLCENQDADEENVALDNFKLIQMVIPTDKNTGEILADGEIAKQYFYDTKQELPPRMGFVGLPFDLKTINLGDVASKDLDYSSKLQETAYDGAGVSTEMFNGSRSNNQAVVYSQITDSILAFKLLEQFQAFLNKDFSYNSALSNFEICFIKSTIYNQNEILDKVMSNATTFVSRLQMLACQHLEPYQAYNIILQEKMMNIDNNLTPLMTSHTMTADDLNNTKDDAGNDTKDNTEEDIKNDTKKINNKKKIKKKGRPSIKSKTGGEKTGEAQN